jgi:predicted amidohydrolase YtcJ
MAARLTTYVVVAIVAATLIAGLIVGAQRDDSSGPVDLIIHNAKVYAADPLGSMAEAVAVRGNTILHVGTSREILRYRRPQTTVIDAKGVAVLPGFIDSHASFVAGGLARDGVDLFGADTLEEMQQRVSDWAEAHPDEGWIVGRGWAYQRFGDLPGRAQLDAAVKDRPVVMRSQDGHAAWVNTRALQVAGVVKRIPDPKNGVIVRDVRTGEPTGLLKDAAVALVTRAIPQPTREERMRALRLAIRDAQEHGITSVQDVGSTMADLELYDEARHAGDLTVRVYAAASAATPLTPEYSATLEVLSKRYADDPLLKTGLAVIPLDGAIESETASMLNPYAPRGAGSGLLKLSAADLHQLVRALDSRGWQIAIEASGDRAVREALDAYEAAAASSPGPLRGRRHRVEGAEVIDPEDLPRFRGLNLVASLQPLHASPDRLDVWSRNLGAERASLGWAAHTLLEGGAHLTFGTDWPNLPQDPIAGLHVAVNRTAPSVSLDQQQADVERPIDVVPYAGETLALRSAINGWTSAAAWASFDEHRKGVIKPGMLADLVVLSSDIFKAAPDELARTEVNITVFDGKVVYRRDLRHSTN